MDRSRGGSHRIQERIKDVMYGAQILKSAIKKIIVKEAKDSYSMLRDTKIL